LELSQLIVQISDTAFSSHPLGGGGLGTTYDMFILGSLESVPQWTS